jgi:hypothetical protein
MKSVKISLGDFTRLVSQEAHMRHSKLSIDTSVPVPTYQVRSPVRPENLDKFLAWLEGKAEINITAANISDLSLLSAEFGVLDFAAKYDISSVSNFQNCNQQIEAIWNRIGRLEESVWSSLRKLRTACEAKLSEMKRKRENDNERVIGRMVSVERKVTEITGRLSTCETISDLFSPLISRQTVCEGSLEHMKSEWANQNRSLKSVERSVSLLSGELERKITESLSPVTPAVSPSKSLKEVEFPLQKAQSLEGIIFDLTRKHGGNVHEKGTVANQIQNQNRN